MVKQKIIDKQPQETEPIAPHSIEHQLKCPELPLEIQYRIIEVFKNNRRCLLQLSLVAKAWHRLTRNELFNSVILYAEHIIPFLHTVQSSLCTIRECVHSLQLHPFWERNIGPRTMRKVSGIELVVMGRLLPNLRYLSFNRLPITAFTPTTKVSFQQTFVHVEVLALEGMNAVLRGRGYFELISSFPNLKKLMSRETPDYFWNDLREFSPMPVLPELLTEIVLAHPRQDMMDFLAVSPCSKNITTLELTITICYRTVASAVKVLQNIGESLVNLTLLNDRGVSPSKNPWDFSKNPNLAMLVLKGEFSYAIDGQTWITEILEKIGSPRLRKLVFSIRQFNKNTFQQRWPHNAVHSLFQRRKCEFEGLEECVYVARGGVETWGEKIKDQVEASFSPVARSLKWEGRKVLKIRHVPAQAPNRRLMDLDS